MSGVIFWTIVFAFIVGWLCGRYDRSGGKL